MVVTIIVGIVALIIGMVIGVIGWKCDICVGLQCSGIRYNPSVPRPDLKKCPIINTYIDSLERGQQAFANKNLDGGCVCQGKAH